MPIDFQKHLARKNEERARDKALDLLNEHRARLIGIARKIAVTIARRRGTVTSVQVLAAMEIREVDFRGADRRFMGAVFRTKGVWRKVGYDTTGSHCRPVAVWELVP